MALYNIADTVAKMMDVAMNGTETQLPDNPFKEYVEDARAYIKDGFQTIATTIDNVRHNVIFDGIPPIEEQPTSTLTNTGIRLVNHCANMLGLNFNIDEAGELITNFVSSLATSTINTPFGIIDLTTKGGYVLADYLSKGMNAIIENIQLGGEGGFTPLDLPESGQIETYPLSTTNLTLAQFEELLNNRWGDFQALATNSHSSSEPLTYPILNLNSFTEFLAQLRDVMGETDYNTVFNNFNGGYFHAQKRAGRYNYFDYNLMVITAPITNPSYPIINYNGFGREGYYIVGNSFNDSSNFFTGHLIKLSYNNGTWDLTNSGGSYPVYTANGDNFIVGGDYYTYAGEWSFYQYSPGGDMTDGLSYQDGENQGTVQDTIDAITGDDGFDTDKFLQYLEDHGYNHLSKMLTDEDGNQHLMLPTNLSEIFGLVNDIRELNKNKADLLDNVQANDDNLAYGQDGVVGKLADDGITSPLNMITVGVNERVYTEGRELYLRQIVPILREGLTPDNNIFKFEYDGSIKNLKVFAGELNSYIIISKCTGNQMRFNPEDIIKLDNFIPHNQKPEFNITADLRVQGSPKMFPRYYHNTPNNLMLGLITGHTWLNAVNVFYGRYGSELANNNYQMGSKTLLVNSNFEQLGNAVKLAPAALAGAGIAGGLASKGLSTAVGYSYDPASFSQSAASMGILQGSLNTIGTNSLNFGTNLSKSTVNNGTMDTVANVFKNEYNYRQQKGQLDYAQLMATNPTVAPAIEFPYEESNVDLYGNYFTIARYYLSETQRKFLDDFYTLWGYKTGGIDITTDNMDWLHSRAHFNYLSMSNVSLAKKEISVFERQEMEAELGNIRLWHDMLPKDWSQSDGNNIVEVGQ